MVLWIKWVQSTSSCWTFILILCCICLGSPSAIFLSVMLPWVPYAFVIFPMSHSSHPARFHHHNSVWWRIKTVEPQVSSFLSLPLRSRYSTSIQNKRKTRNNYFFFRLSNCYSPSLNNVEQTYGTLGRELIVCGP